MGDLASCPFETQAMYGYKLVFQGEVMMLSCKEIARLISAGLDRDLKWHERLKIRGHFLICRMCEVHSRQIQFLHKAVKSMFEDEHEEDLEESVRLDDETKQRMKERLNSNEPELS